MLSSETAARARCETEAGKLFSPAELLLTDRGSLGSSLALVLFHPEGCFLGHRFSGAPWSSKKQWVSSGGSAGELMGEAGGGSVAEVLDSSILIPGLF